MKGCRLKGPDNNLQAFFLWFFFFFLVCFCFIRFFVLLNLHLIFAVRFVVHLRYSNLKPLGMQLWLLKIPLH